MGVRKSHGEAEDRQHGSEEEVKGRRDGRKDIVG
jgi:hypothetical protein